MGQGKRPESEVACSVANSSKHELERLNQLVDSRLSDIIVQHNTFLPDKAEDLILGGPLLLRSVVRAGVVLVVEGGTLYFLQPKGWLAHRCLHREIPDMG